MIYHKQRKEQVRYFSCKRKELSVYSSVLCIEQAWTDTRELVTLAASGRRIWWPGARWKGNILVYTVLYLLNFVLCEYSIQLCEYCPEKLKFKKKKKWKPPSRSSSLLLWASVTVFRLGPVFILTFPASTDWLQSLLGGHGWVTFVFPRVVRTSFGAERKVTIGLFTVYWCQEFTFGRQVDLQSGSMIRTGNSASLSIKITQISWNDFQQT